jgi:ubiquinone biosynthesis accessory factor UbiJ
VLDSSVAGATNHLLRGAAWAREELRRHAGKTVRVEAAPFIFLLTVGESGLVSAAMRDAVPAATITLTPGLALRLAVRDEAAWSEVGITGDTDFAAAINNVARNVRWDFEEDLSRVFGDIAAHRLAETVRTLQRWRQQSAENLARSAAEYWTEERRLIASGYAVREFIKDVDALRDDVARLEKRLQYLLNRQTHAGQ